jgi:hypothetical protein
MNKEPQSKRCRRGRPTTQFTLSDDERQTCSDGTSAYLNCPPIDRALVTGEAEAERLGSVQRLVEEWRADRRAPQTALTPSPARMC